VADTRTNLTIRGNKANSLVVRILVSHAAVNKGELYLVGFSQYLAFVCLIAFTSGNAYLAETENNIP